jgi:hypothetical protein
MVISKAIRQTVIFAAALLIFSTSFAAQTRRNNPAPTPTPRTDLPVIISRADDFPDENRTQPSPTPEVEREITSGRSTAELRMLAERASAEKDEKYEAKQRRLLMNLDILTRAEERSENLRKQLFEMIEKENEIQSRLSDIEYSVLPETIDRNLAFTGSLKPEELREMRKKTLEAEKTNQEKLLLQVQERKNSLILTVQKADDMVEKLRTKLEREIDEALTNVSDQ